VENDGFWFLFLVVVVAMVMVEVISEVVAVIVSFSLMLLLMLMLLMLLMLLVLLLVRTKTGALKRRYPNLSFILKLVWCSLKGAHQNTNRFEAKMGVVFFPPLLY